LIEAARRSGPPPRDFRVSRPANSLRRWRFILSRTAAGLELFDRHQNIVHFALHVGWRALPAVTQKPRDFTNCLPGTLIGNAVNHDDGYAIGCAHRPIRMTRTTEMAFA